MQAASAQDAQLRDRADPDARQYPVTRFTVGIDCSAADGQEAQMPMDSTSGPLWGAGYAHTLHRTSSGE
jgi:hypothetical protein